MIESKYFRFVLDSDETDRGSIFSVDSSEVFGRLLCWGIGPYADKWLFNREKPALDRHCPDVRVGFNSPMDALNWLDKWVVTPDGS